MSCSVEECDPGINNCCKGKSCCDACDFEFTICKPGDGCREEQYFKLSENPSEGSGYVISNPLEFINGLSVRSSTRALQASHGVDDSLSWYNQRVMVAEGFIFACSRCELAHYTNQMKKVLGLESNQSYFGQNGYINLTYLDEDCVEKGMCVKVVEPPTFEYYEENNCHLRRFSFIVATQNEKILSCSIKEACGDESPMEGWSPCDGICPDSAITQSPEPGVEACNDGCYNASPTITIQGPAEYPRITNLNTCDYMEVETTIGDTDSIVIDVESRTIKKVDYLGNETDITGLLSATSDWIFLGPCCNQISLTTRRPDLLAASFCISWQDTYI